MCAFVLNIIHGTHGMNDQVAFGLGFIMFFMPSGHSRVRRHVHGHTASTIKSPVYVVYV
jgi:hypothetical protein